MKQIDIAEFNEKRTVKSLTVLAIYWGLLLGNIDFMLLPISGMTFKNLSMFAVFFVIPWNNPKQYLPRNFKLAIVFLVVYSFVRGYNIIDSNWQDYMLWSAFLNVVTWIPLIYSISYLIFNELNLHRFIFLIGVVYCIAIVFYLLTTPNFCFYDGLTKSFRFYGCRENPNDFALHAQCVFWLTLFSFCKRNSTLYLQKIVSIIIMIFLLLCITLTGSRANILSLIFVGFIFTFLKRGWFKSLKTFSLLVFFVLVLIYICYFWRDSYVISSIINRFFLDVETDIDINKYSGGRIDIAIAYLQAIRESPVHGYAAAQYVPWYIPISFKTGTPCIPHNFILSYTVFGGMLTTLSLVILLFQIFLQTRKIQFLPYFNILQIGFVSILLSALSLGMPLESIIFLFLFIFHQCHLINNVYTEQISNVTSLLCIYSTNMYRNNFLK